MPYRTTPLAKDQVYHIYNQGVAKASVFKNKSDFSRLIRTFTYYRHLNPPVRLSQVQRWLTKFKEIPIKPGAPKLVDIYSYCLMPNHFHLLVKQLTENGISIFIRRSINSYTRYFNTRHQRVGPLFKGPFKVVRIATDEQLVHVSRYIHLNPLVSFLVRELADYSWSSYPAYLDLRKDTLCYKEKILSHFRSPQDYQKFVLDHADYAKKLEEMKHLLFD